jgi:hypothetical protein
LNNFFLNFAILQRSASPEEEEVIAQKRSKEASMDPFDSEILHEDVHPYIAQHFNGKDLLTMSEVSTSWNEFAEGKKIGDKVRLKIDMGAMQTGNFKTIAGDPRTYKDVSVDVGNTASSAALWIFADTVEKLKVSVMKHEANKDFPKLKVLDLTLHDDTHWILKSQMDQLEELKLTLKYEVDYEPDNYFNAKAFLARLKNLKRLDLFDCNDRSMEIYVPEPLFQLEYYKGCLDDNREFLYSQRGSLQTVKIFRNYKLIVQDLFSDYPMLTTLEVLDVWDAEWIDDEDENIEIAINTTIKSLKLQFRRDQPVDVSCREILLALPELESLDIEKLSTQIMELIALNLLKLKELKCDIIEDGAWERYEEMKREGVEGMNMRIQLGINIDKKTF